MLTSLQLFNALGIDPKRPKEAPVNLTPAPSGQPSRGAGQIGPMDIPGTQRELAAWERRGGVISPRSPLAHGAEKGPDGTLYGGEFSPEDDSAYVAAANKLHLAKEQQRLEAAIASMRQKPDASAVTPK